MSSRAARLNKLEECNGRDVRTHIVLVLDGETQAEALRAYHATDTGSPVRHFDTLRYVTKREFTRLMKGDCHHKLGEECETDEMVADIIGERRASRSGTVYTRPLSRDDCLGYEADKQARYLAKQCGAY